METRAIAIKNIKIEDRQRGEISPERLKLLADSIEMDGLINPIFVAKEGKGQYVLIAGERRLRAHELLGIDKIRSTIIDAPAEERKQRIELIENTQRENLSWQDECMAVFDYYFYMRALPAQFSVEKCADDLGYTYRHMQKKINVAHALKKGDEQIRMASGFSAAYGILERQSSRAVSDEVANVTAILNKGGEIQEQPDGQIKVKLPPSLHKINVDKGNISDEVLIRDPGLDIVQGDSLELFSGYSDQPFNFVHCDFPYGINFHKSDQGNPDDYGAYEDSPEVYFNLVSSLLENREKIFAPSSHLLFWFSFTIRTKDGDFDNWTYLRETFTSAGFRVWPRPFIWLKADKSGIIPDPQRGPRRIYETCLFASRGDRKILKSTVDAVAVATERSSAVHLSIKPEPVLEPFFRMLVDGNTRFLDPTCGGGTAVCLADKMGADTVKGWELLTENVELAQNNLRRSRLINLGLEMKEDDVLPEG